MSERQEVADWMINHGFATGHGDSVADLLGELEWQLIEQFREVRRSGRLTNLELIKKGIVGK